MTLCAASGRLQSFLCTSRLLMEEWMYTSIHSKPRHCLEVSGQPHVPAFWHLILQSVLTSRDSSQHNSDTKLYYNPLLNLILILGMRGTGTRYRHTVQTHGTGTRYRHTVRAQGTGTRYRHRVRKPAVRINITYNKHGTCKISLVSDIITSL